MKRFKCISIFGSTYDSEYKVPECPKGNRIVDDSKFIPMSEAVKQMSKLPPMAQGVIDGYYDFPDGKDDGRKVNVARMKPEIVELSVDVRKQQEQLKKDLKKAQRIAEDKAMFESFKIKPKEIVKE